MSSPLLQTRRASEDDRLFLWRLHRDTLRAYVEPIWGWDDERQWSLFRDQRDLSKYEVVMHDGRDIGCLRVDERPDDLCLDYIAILPSDQGRGFGTQLVIDVLQRATARQLRVRLSVLKSNPARRLYLRLGFHVTGEDVHRFHMEYSPGRPGGRD
jgi:ribosomal protein S18 acetylase RimI-like enzyme